MDSVEKPSREEYFRNQIEASRKKFRFCKVSTRCVERFKELIYKSSGGNSKGPILCLGTRNGRELDIFRNLFFGGRLKSQLMKLSEKEEHAFSSRVSFLESWGKSSIENIGETSVIGVEINPDGKRRDVLICSFDEMPAEWAGKFKIVYSNTLDHAHNPLKAAKEWYRVLASGGHMILGFPGEPVKTTSANPSGDLGFEEIKSFFPGELIYYNKYGNCFADAIIKKR